MSEDRKHMLTELLSGVVGNADNGSSGGGGFYNGPEKKGQTDRVRLLPPPRIGDSLGVKSFRYWFEGQDGFTRHYRGAPAHPISYELRGLAELLGSDHPQYGALVAWPKGKPPVGIVHKISMRKTFLVNVAVRDDIESGEGGSVQIWRMPYPCFKEIFEGDEAALGTFLKQKKAGFNPFDPEVGHDLLITHRSSRGFGQGNLNPSFHMDASPVGIEGWEEDVKDLQPIEDKNLGEMAVDEMLEVVSGICDDVLGAINHEGYRSAQEIWDRIKAQNKAPVKKVKTKPDPKELYNG